MKKKIKGLIYIYIFLMAFCQMMNAFAAELKIRYETKEVDSGLEITYYLENLTNHWLEKVEFVDELEEEMYRFRQSEIIEEIKPYGQGRLTVTYEKSPTLFGITPLAIYKLFLLGGIFVFFLFLSLLLFIAILLARKEKRRRLEAGVGLEENISYPTEAYHGSKVQEDSECDIEVEKKPLGKKETTSFMILLLLGLSISLLTSKVNGAGVDKVMPYRDKITLSDGTQNISGYFKYQLNPPKDISEQLQKIEDEGLNFYEYEGERIYYAKDLEELKGIVRYLGNQFVREYKIDVQTIREANPNYSFEDIHLILREGMRGTYEYSLLTRTDIQFDYLQNNLILGVQLELTVSQEELEEIDEVILDLIKTYQLNEKPPREAALFFHDWLIQTADYYTPYIDDENNQYNEEGIFVHSPYAVICGKQTVCQGYASWFTRAMSLAGFEVYYLEGIIYDDEGKEVLHAWNGVRDGENIYYIDVTFDDPIGSYQNQFHTWDYFWTEDKTMGNTHFEKTR